MSTETVLIQMGCDPESAQALENACIKFNIWGTAHKAHFIGQVYVETGGFKATRESMNYSVDGLMKTFGRHRISAADCQKFGRIDKFVGGKKVGILRYADQQSIANTLYGGEWGLKNLGNKVWGDGWKYRGGGDKQLTGLANFTGYSKDVLGTDLLVRSPELIEVQPYRSDAAGWFWKKNNLNAIVDKYDDPYDAIDDIAAVYEASAAVTKVVNGGANGLALRRQKTEEALVLFGHMRVPYTTPPLRPAD